VNRGFKLVTRFSPSRKGRLERPAFPTDTVYVLDQVLICSAVDIYAARASNSEPDTHRVMTLRLTDSEGGCAPLPGSDQPNGCAQGKELHARCASSESNPYLPDKCHRKSVGLETFEIRIKSDEIESALYRHCSEIYIHSDLRGSACSIGQYLLYSRSKVGRSISQSLCNSAV